MTELQHRLLEALAISPSGVFDRYNRLLVAGQLYPAATVLSAFRWGWIVSDGCRARFTAAGREALRLATKDGVRV